MNRPIHVNIDSQGDLWAHCPSCQNGYLFSFPEDLIKIENKYFIKCDTCEKKVQIEKSENI